jgi:hypothetical protein
MSLKREIDYKNNQVYYWSGRRWWRIDPGYIIHSFKIKSLEELPAQLKEHDPKAKEAHRGWKATAAQRKRRSDWSIIT